MDNEHDTPESSMTPGPAGGQGGIVQDGLTPGHRRADAAMIGRAIREGWAIPEQAYRLIPNELTLIALNRKPGALVTVREQVSASRVLVQMDRTNEDVNNGDKPPSQVNVNVGIVNLPANERAEVLRSIAARIRDRVEADGVGDE